MSTRFAFRLSLLCAVLLLAVVASVLLGAAPIPVGEILDTLLGGGEGTSRTIILDLRLPRAVMAALVGGGLGLSGAVFQALLRNPLADPYVLGVSGGAAVGAVLAVVLGWDVLAPWALPLSALLGGLAAIGLVLRIATQASRTLDTRVLLLAGVVIGAFLNAVILLILTFASAETFRSAVFWMMGSLAGASWGANLLLVAYVAPAALALMAMARPFNLIAVGEETALYLGTRVERVKFAAYMVASLLVAAGVAVSGIIGFVGLIVPHAVRLLWGSDHQLLLPASFLLGASFLLVTDMLARTAAAPSEIPVGVITALVGVPLFVVLLTRRAV